MSARTRPPSTANGDVDEAQAVLGLARAEAEPGSELDGLLSDLERDLWVLMAEVATAPENRHKLRREASLVTARWWPRWRGTSTTLNERFEMPKEFVVPGQNRVSARWTWPGRWCAAPSGDSRSVAMDGSDTQVGPYLNRLSDLLWTMARWQEGEHLLAREGRSETKGQGSKRTNPKKTSTKKRDLTTEDEKENGTG